MTNEYIDLVLKYIFTSNIYCKISVYTAVFLKNTSQGHANATKGSGPELRRN